MARTPGTPGALDPQVRLEVGRQALLSLRSTLAGAGLTRGDAATLPHIEQFCSTQHATAARLPGVVLTERCRRARRLAPVRLL